VRLSVVLALALFASGCGGCAQPEALPSGAAAQPPPRPTVSPGGSVHFVALSPRVVSQLKLTADAGPHD